MTEIKVATRSLVDEAGTRRRYHYSLLVDQVEAGSFFCEDYGVKVVEEAGDSASVPGITTSATRIDELLELLVAHLVGPTALRDVVEDWL